jgi:hypothetical protein
MVSYINRLCVFENRIRRRIFGPKRDANEKWRRFHNEELHSLYRAPNIVRVIKFRRLRWAGSQKQKRPSETPRCRWEENISMNLK